jgi:fatty acid desaturase
MILILIFNLSARFFFCLSQHHSYTNHDTKDPDSFGAEPLLLFNDYKPGHTKRKFMHNFQGFYYPLVLAGYWLSSVFNPEIIDLRQGGAMDVGFVMESEYIYKSRKYAVALRLLYIATNIVAPFIYNGDFSFHVLGHILVMGASSSLHLAILFALSHNFEQVDRDPTYEVRKTGEPVCWFKSQVETSSTYGGFISGCTSGGLNFQIEHHLFPRMSSAWYPFIAPKVREICKKHGVRYIYYPWIWQNLISTAKYIHKAGTGANWANGNPYSGKQ